MNKETGQKSVEFSLLTEALHFGMCVSVQHRNANKKKKRKGEKNKTQKILRVDLWVPTVQQCIERDYYYYYYYYTQTDRQRVNGNVHR